MPGTTGKGLPYPVAGDNPAVHTDIYNLAAGVDTLLDSYLSGTIGASGLAFEGSTNDANETTLNVVDPTADRTVSLPNESGVLATQHFARTFQLMLGGM